MGKIDSHGALSIAEIAFYGPALLLSIVVCSKQGFTKNAGWLYLCLISVLRLIGSSVELYITTQNDYSQSLLETAAITSAIGLSPLLLTLLGILQRLHAHMLGGAGFSQNIFRPIHLVGIIGLILGIIGGSKSANINSDHYDTGRDLSEASSLLFLIVYIALAAISILTAMSKASYIPAQEKKLLVAAICVLPFILVRTIYSIASAFSTPGSIFYFQTPNVWVQAFMMFAMEAIAVSFYIWAGLFTPKTPVIGNYDRGVESYSMKPNEVEGQYHQQQPEPRQGIPVPTQEKPARGNQQRSIGDYRPSRLIRNAIQNRGG